MTPVTAVVLAGGEARRMGGIDKHALRLGGATLLDRVLAAAEPVSRRLVVVGPPRPTDVGHVAFVTEPQPGGGPVPAVLSVVTQADVAEDEVVLVLAGDLPFLTGAHLKLLIDAVVRDRECEAAAARGEGDGKAGRPNPLLAAYRGRHLRAMASLGLGPGSPAAGLLPPSTIAVTLPALATFNVNSPADLERASALLAQTTRSSPA